MLPLSPNSDHMAPDKLPFTDPMLQLFDANATMASPMSSAAAVPDDQLGLFNASILTGEFHKLEAVL